MSNVINFPNIELARMEKKVIKLTTSIKGDLISLSQKRDELLKIRKELRKLESRLRLTVVKNELEPDPSTSSDR